MFQEKRLCHFRRCKPGTLISSADYNRIQTFGGSEELFYIFFHSAVVNKCYKRLY